MDDLRALIAAATPGPWETDEFVHGTVTILQSGNATEAMCVADLAGGLTDLPDENAALIVAAVNALPGLLDVVEAARRYTADPVGKTTSQIMADFDAIRYALAHLEDPK